VRVFLDDFVCILEDGELLADAFPFQGDVVGFNHFVHNVFALVVDRLPHVVAEGVLGFLDQVVADQLGDGVAHVADHDAKLVVQPRPDLPDEHVVGVVLLVHEVLVLHHEVPVVGEDLVHFRFNHCIYLLFGAFFFRTN